MFNDKKWVWSKDNPVALASFILTFISIGIYLYLIFMQSKPQTMESLNSQLPYILSWLSQQVNFIALIAAIASLFPQFLEKGGLGFIAISLLLLSFQPIIGFGVYYLLFIAKSGAHDPSMFASLATMIPTLIIQLSLLFWMMKVAMKQLKKG